MVFEEQMDEFENAINKVHQELKSVNQPNEKKYSVEKLRTQHPKAYLPWTTAEDAKLEQLYCEGKTGMELSQLLERNEGAIQARIKKLGLKEKYS